MKFPLFGVEFGLGRQIAGALIVRTFVDGLDLGFFPEVQSAVAARAPVLGL